MKYGVFHHVFITIFLKFPWFSLFAREIFSLRLLQIAVKYALSLPLCDVMTIIWKKCTIHMRNEQCDIPLNHIPEMRRFLLFSILGVGYSFQTDSLCHLFLSNLKSPCEKITMCFNISVQFL